MPMYNESQAIENTIKKLTSVAKELTGDYEIVVANDGSTDDSGLIIDKIAERDDNVKTVHLKRNTKFGGALKAGLKHAKNDIIIYTDSDLPIETEDIKKALALLGEADIVTAYSKIRKGATLRRKIMSKGYNMLVQFLFRTNIRDINSGFKIYKRKVFDGIELISKSPFIDVEIFVNAIRKGFTVKQYPVIFKHREAGKSYISRPQVVLKTFLDMVRFRFSG